MLTLLSHSVNGDVTGEMKQYAVTMAPIDGLTLAASYYDFGEMGNKDGRQKARRWFSTQLITQSVKFQ